MLTLLAAFLAFVLVAGIGLAVAGTGGPGGRTMKRAQAITAGGRLDRAARAKAANDPGARRKQLLANLKDQERRQRKASLSLAAQLQQAGLEVTVAQYWIASGVVAVLVIGIAAVLHGPWFVLAGMGFVGGVGLPRWVLTMLANKRKKKFTEHFPDAIDIIVRGVKSGLPVHDCLKIIARESSAPLGPEFNRLVENLGMGVSMDQGLEKMFDRMPTSELRFFTIVLAIQQKTGGNLAEALGNLSVVLRSRKLMREKIKAMSAEATASAFIIGCLPPGVITLISVSAPAYMAVMFKTPKGNFMLAIGATLMASGVFVMRKMINFKF